MNITVAHTMSEAMAFWKELESGADQTGFQHSGLLACWLETIGQARQVLPCIVQVRDEGRAPLMLLPLCIRNVLGARVLEFMDGGVCDYNAPVLAPGAEARLNSRTFAPLWHRILKALPPVDAAHFVKIPPRVGSQPNPMAFLPKAPSTVSAHSLGVSGIWEAYYAGRVKKRIRADSRRQMRRLKEIGPVDMAVVRDPDEAVAVTEAMIRHKSRRYRETGAGDMFSRSGYADFYRLAARRLALEGPVHVSALRVDGQVAATHWGLAHKGRFYLLMPTYEGGDWRRYSVGRLLLEFLLERAFAREYDVFDFTIGGEAYKNDWCDRQEILDRYQACLGPRGLAFDLATRAEYMVRNNPEFKAGVRRVLSRLHASAR